MWLFSVLQEQRNCAAASRAVRSSTIFAPYAALISARNDTIAGGMFCDEPEEGGISLGRSSNITIGRSPAAVLRHLGFQKLPPKKTLELDGR